ncbi:MAG: formylglycine-generating enzyme family protein [Saprospiraceae bacterium]|nr:formylglycine-generating enzyme family protein [Saprospiraceae bacterium]
MKKLFFICLASIMVCVSLDAQIENTGEKKSYSIETLEDVPNNSDTCLDQHPPPIFKDPILDTFILVKGGTFQMGSKEDGPIHTVTLCDYYIGQTEVTEAQWRAIMGTSPKNFNDCDSCPVSQVSWDDIYSFILKINELRGAENYRLPTEAEWEYAALGGVFKSNYKHAGSNRLKDIGWYKENSHGETKAVGLKQSNALGLYDMNGNVLEWCLDHWHDSYEHAPNTAYPWTYTRGDHGHILRGGAWNYPAKDCRISFRHGSHAEDAGFDFGFRLAFSELLKEF